MSSLVFFDTFSHEASDVTKLDLVQFPKAVHVSEVRVIPLGARVKADFPGGVRLGATNPSQFVIDFFVNDRGKRGATTFENVGQLQYNQQGPIKLDFDKTPPTDGLLLRGSYNTITLAVYGTLSKANRDPPPKSPPPPPPPPAPVSPPPAQVPIRHSSGTRASVCSPGKRDPGSGVVGSPSLPHPLPEKVNPNERIRDWLQDTQVPHSPLDLDQSPAKEDWEEPSFDGEPSKDEISPAPPPPSPPPSHTSRPHSPRSHSPRPHSPRPHSPRLHSPRPHSPRPHSPRPHSHPHSPRPHSPRLHSPRPHSPRPHTPRPHSPPHSPSPEHRSRPSHSRVSSSERSHRRREDRSSREHSRDRVRDRSAEKIYDRSVDKSQDAMLDRSRDRSDRESERAGRSGRDRRRRSSRDRSRDHSARRSLSAHRSQAIEGKDYGEIEREEMQRSRVGGRTREKKEKRSKDARRSKDEKREKRKAHDSEWVEGGSHRKQHHRRYSCDSLQEAGPRTPPPPPLPIASPHWPEKDGEDEQRDLKRQKVDAEGDVTTATQSAMLFPEEHMEAISDDEDLPDLPLEDPDVNGAAEFASSSVAGAALAAPGTTDAMDGPEAQTTAGAPAVDLDFEEIMSDEEELPEYQEFEDEANEEEYIVEEWEDWLKPPCILEEFQFVAPLVHLCNPALTAHQRLFAAHNAASHVNAAPGNCSASPAITNDGVAIKALTITAADPSSGISSAVTVDNAMCEPNGASSSVPAESEIQSHDVTGAPVVSENSAAHANGTVVNSASAAVTTLKANVSSTPLERFTDPRDKKDGPASKLLAAVASGYVPSLNTADEQRENFVHSCEQVLALLPSALHLLPPHQIMECVSTLCGWIAASLDMECAMAQPQPVYKIRHLKAGIRLCTQLCLCSDDITRHLLYQLPLLHALRALYLEPLMAISIKLLIVRCIDSILSTCTGVQMFLSLQPKLDQTGYELLLQLLTDTTNTRAKAALAAVLRKLHLLEVVEKLRDDVTALQSLVPPLTILDTEETNQDAHDIKLRPEANVERKSGPTCATPVTLPPSGGTDDEWCAATDMIDVDDSSVRDDEIGDEAEDEEPPRPVFSVPRALISSITSCLSRILHTYTHAELLLAQPTRYLPAGKQFQVPRCPYDILQEVWVLLQLGDLVPSLAYLCNALTYELQLTTPIQGKSESWQEASAVRVVSSLVSRLITAIASSPRGLTFFAVHHRHSTALIKALLRTIDGDSASVHGRNARAYHLDESPGYPPLLPQDLGVLLIEQLHVLHQLDSLASLSARWNVGDSSENDSSKLTEDQSQVVGRSNTIDVQQSLVHLNALVGIMYSHRSKLSLIKTLATGDYLDLLMPYLNLLAPKDSAESAPQKAACVGYAIEILAATVKFDGNATFLENYSEKICQIIENWETRGGPQLEEAAKLSELLPWLSISRKRESFSYDNIPQLVEAFKGQLDHVDKFPGELFTLLRIMESLAIPPKPTQPAVDNQENEEVIQELKYQYAIVQFFSADLITHLNSFFIKLANLNPQPGLHVAKLGGSQGGLLVCLLRPALTLIHALLQQVIRARGAAYRDLSSVQPLLSTYLLLSSFPESCPHWDSASPLQRLVLQTLLLYTQPGHIPDTPCDVNALWPQMLLQILKFCDRAPHTIVAGLCLLTELLPLPLPVSGRQLTAGEKERYIVVRKLWATNIAPLGEDFHQLIINLAPGAHASLTYALRRTIVALADLAPQTVMIVVRPLLDLCLQYQRLDDSYRDLSRVMYTLASLASHAGIKAALLHLFMSEPYSALLSHWTFCVTAEGEAGTHVRYPRCLLVLHLCRAQNNLLSGYEGLQWGVPCRELLAPLLECQVSLLAQPAVTQRLLQPLLLCLLDVSAHDYGLFHLKTVLDKRRGCLLPVLQSLVSDLPRSEEALETLQILMNLIHSLLYPDASVLQENAAPQSNCDTRVPVQLRSMAVSVADLCNYLSWPGTAKLKNISALNPESNVGLNGAPHDKNASDRNEGENLGIAHKAAVSTTAAKITSNGEKATLTSHPLQFLADIVVNCEAHECLLERLYVDITELLAMLVACDPLDSCARVSEVTEEDGGWMGRGGRSVTQQYDQRLVCCPPSADLESPKLWLQSPPSLYADVFDDPDHDLIPMSLSELLRDCHVSDFDLEASVQKVLRGHQAGLSPQKGPMLSKGPTKFRGSSIPTRAAAGRGIRPYGFATRGLNSRSDPFRCRPPNTSRPPSLHVDDFVALESTGHQPTGPTGYNRISFGRGKMILDGMRGRGSRGMTRGDGRGGPMPGRFMYRPMYRPDFNNRGMMNRGMRWNFRGGDGVIRSGPMTMASNQYRPQTPGGMGMRFMRGRGMFARGAPGGYGDRGGRHMRGGFH
ncbi:protein virilizer [Hyalella azteca]|uniref:Protein virilizer n=1 Tax=Hyalella azteca TaxID=294128 RepID=A0A8B7NMA4_HYAAZ|nr:protein virilizer [Hyalella azteca]